MNRKTWLVALAYLLIGSVASAQGQPPQQEVKVVTTKLGGNVYGIDGQGGRAAALVGPDGIFMVDSQFARVSDKIVAALKEISPAAIRFLVNTHVHGDHTGGNENFAKLGATILGRPELREQLLNPRPAPGNGQVPPVAPPAALPIVLYDAPTTVYLDGETIRLVPLPAAHTNGDTAVKFEQADVLMTGDVFRSQGFPAAGVTNGGSYLGTIDALNKLIEMAGPNTKVVPGHGPVVGKAELVFHRDMAVTVRDRVAKMLKQKKTAEQILAAKPTAEFEEKVGGPPAFIPQFVNGLIAELSGPKKR
ncbi:MAG TPA: MBL fold metallo-hydrolase [Gammaproteobacteria bacterium]|nr:MBL fold metallo-hydrolase [Gammaproteobacteria bacterium]